jgi:cobalamin biosynthesis Co2+ chelatase CbiK
VGILLAAFASSQTSAQVSFENIDKNTVAAFPGTPIHWAYTSHIIRKKLAKRGSPDGTWHPSSIHRVYAALIFDVAAST